ncbi:testicular acid phosphatase homolog [Sitodiplosis mosellana]|uniref:testicular acid phosphatase homolog n=1 Tax=Sitodiplosis mosellana TaxID=263140 RepID=UPI0024449593|nr:testicular acid phosphatase homolog [Sitodiplosis mosellana]XP_055300681.1 testicular acid phosphatase homolog [Sitodiplosis mosellana]
MDGKNEGPNCICNDDELIFANVIYRHGCRNIDRVFPNDPHKDEINWPGGIRQLRNEGKQQQYKLGQYFRRRYGKLLGPKYSSNKVYVRSSDFDRTLMSAQANLCGLFAPTKDEVWNEELPLAKIWQPIPVHTVPQKDDYVIFGLKNAKYEAELKKFMSESPEIQTILTQHADKFKLWSQMSGLDIVTFNDVQQLYDTYNIENWTNKPLSEDAKKEIEPNGVMEYVAKWHFKLESATPLLARLRSGFLLKEILEHFTQKINKTLQPDRSIFFYSAHDSTISYVLNSLGLFELHFPPFASSLHFELYRTSKNEHYFQLFYRKSENEEILTPLNIPNCGEKCTLDQFYKVYSAIIPDESDFKCD